MASINGHRKIMCNIEVSICCLTYNHVTYIEKALKGFLVQQTDFAYEILIHDDASTDGTTEILLKYREKYPDIIHLYLEEENQYNTGKHYTKMLLSEAKGKYVAFCEGDDFWIYDRKLQKQYDFMEIHPGVSACYHNAIIYSQKDDLIKLNIMDQPSGYISDEDAICTTKGWYPTASLFTRVEYMRQQPVFLSPTGDEGTRNYLAYRGKLYYMNRAWCVYREFVEGGWNTKYYQDKNLAADHFKKIVLYFQEFNMYSKGRFERYIKRRLFSGVDKYRNAHYGRITECQAENLRTCINELKTITDHMIDEILNAYYAIYVVRCKNYYRTTIGEQIYTGTGLYIYGAGTEAIKALIELDKHQMSPEGFIVSDRDDLPERILGIPVYEADEVIFDENKRIWPCLIEGREAVLDVLNHKGCKYIIF